MKSKILGLLAVGLLMGFGSAHAVVRYDFTAFSSDVEYGGATYTGGFVLETPNFINADFGANFAPSALLSCSATSSTAGALPCASQFFISFFGASENDRITFGIEVGGGVTQGLYYFFDKGSFGAFGTYATVSGTSDNTGRLIVSYVPEPGTLALLGLGLAGLGLSRRKAN